MSNENKKPIEKSGKNPPPPLNYVKPKPTPTPPTPTKK